MVGPPNNNDVENNALKNEHGIALSIQMPIRWKRDVSFGSFYSWPYDLILRDQAPNPLDSRPVVRNHFAGIELDTVTIGNEGNESLQIPNDIVSATNSKNSSKDDLVVFRGQGRTTRKMPHRFRTSRPSRRWDQDTTTSISTVSTTKVTATRRKITLADVQTTTKIPRLVYRTDYSNYGLMLIYPSNPNFKPPTNVHPNFFGSLPRAHDIENEVDRNAANVLQGPQSQKIKDEQLIFRLGSNSDTKHQIEKIESKSVSTPSVSSPTGTNERNMEQAPSYWNQATSKRASQKTQRTIVLQRNPNKFESVSTDFTLPNTTDGKYSVISITLPSNAKVTDYKWFGLYNMCIKQRMSYVRLDQAEPPRERLIDPLTGWKHNVSSEGAVRIVNCNTVLVPGFSYSASVWGSTLPAKCFFYVGIGDFPSYIVQQVRAYVIEDRSPYVIAHATWPTWFSSSPLRDYRNEDVLVRLPEGWRTFDINFLSVYDENKHEHIGHISIPPLIVPPCDHSLFHTR